MKIEIAQKGIVNTYRISKPTPVMLETGKMANAYINSEIVTKPGLEYKILQIDEQIAKLEAEKVELQEMLSALPVEKTVKIPLEPVLNLATGEMVGGFMEVPEEDADKYQALLDELPVLDTGDTGIIEGEA